MNRKVFALSSVLAMALSTHAAMAQDDPGLTPDMHHCGPWMTNVPCDRLADVQSHRWTPSGSIVVTPAQWADLNKPLDPAKVQRAYEQIEAQKAADPNRDRRERLLQAAGNPEKDGRLDIQAFTPRQWAVAPHHTPWKIAGKSPTAISYYSYSSFQDQGQTETYIAVKLAINDMNGGYSQLSITSGQIDCSRPGVYPRAIFRAYGSSYDPDTGYPLHDDEAPSDVPVDATTLLGPLTARVCDLVNGRPPKY